MDQKDADSWMIRFFCYIFAGNLILLWFGELRHQAKAKHAEAQPLIHDAYHKCRDAWYKILGVHTTQFEWLKKKLGDPGLVETCPLPDNDEIHEILKEAICSFASAFTLISGVSCRAYVRELVCIDPASNPSDRGFVTTTFFTSDEMPEVDSLQNFITDDSHIMELWSHPTSRCFIQGDVTKIPNFRMANCPYGQHFGVKSVAVWPIRKYKKGSPDVVGYLCVDSKCRHAFNERLEFAIGAAFADTLYSLLAGWRAAKNAANGFAA